MDSVKEKEKRYVATEEFVSIGPGAVVARSVLVPDYVSRWPRRMRLHSGQNRLSWICLTTIERKRIKFRRERGNG